MSRFTLLNFLIIIFFNQNINNQDVKEVIELSNPAKGRIAFYENDYSKMYFNLKDFKKTLIRQNKKYDIYADSLLFQHISSINSDTVTLNYKQIKVHLLEYQIELNLLFLIYLKQEGHKF